MFAKITFILIGLLLAFTAVVNSRVPLHRPIGEMQGAFPPITSVFFLATGGNAGEKQRGSAPRERLIRCPLDRLTTPLWLSGRNLIAGFAAGFAGQAVVKTQIRAEGKRA